MLIGVKITKNNGSHKFDIIIYSNDFPYWIRVEITNHNGDIVFNDSFLRSQYHSANNNDANIDYKVKTTLAITFDDLIIKSGLITVLTPGDNFFNVKCFSDKNIIQAFDSLPNNLFILCDSNGNIPENSEDLCKQIF